VSEDLAIATRELVLAIFRLAFTDYVGVAYGHDEPGPDRHTRINPKVQAEAATFLTSPWARHLGELAGFSAQTAWNEAQRNRLRYGLRPPQLRVDPRGRHLTESRGTSEGWLFQQDKGVAA
jgi:hypothetical protein